MPSERDLERLVRVACPPVPPSEGLRARVLARAARPRKAGRVLRLVLPYAAGVLTAIAAERALAGGVVPGGGGAPASREASASVGFESIADRLPPPAPATARDRAAREPEPVLVAFAPVPRIS